ncbi:DNA cytosine methyltransferase [Profundibacterium mesophilum]|uniref:Cytosine-specific methyltransferase n=1 Tax=Profundibacterium mesophilum KAUST100406-0324 TaxID=1037889 RepID=A0A921NYN6_9RHOB|nr:DNA cytosine methyltransferase [Profundibacterium mesophilum]KAF0675908.1 DNA -methyltransferase [Profundibacterium mesophilum KAUST100406-0324]
MAGKKPVAVSLFAGCGGFCEGMEVAGFDVRVAVENDRFACETYRANFPETKLLEIDIHDFLKHEDHHRFCGDDVSVVFGGPPCQGFSQIGPRDIGDERNDLYLEYARVVQTLKPKMFIMENVPNMILMNRGHFKHAIISHFMRLGYSNTAFIKVSAADFGVPQTRERVFFFGTRDDLKFEGSLEEVARSLLAKQKVRRPVTVWEAIGDLPSGVVDSGEVVGYPEAETPSDFMKKVRLDGRSGPFSIRRKRAKKLAFDESGVPMLHNHHTKEIQARRAHLISFLKPGQKANSLPKHIWDGARPEKWRRLHPDLPSYTILAQMHRDLSEWVHPKSERWITVREAARLQSFHDGFVFRTSEWQMLKQIGNAVPPLLGRAAGQMALGILQRVENSYPVDEGVESEASPQTAMVAAE